MQRGKVRKAESTLIGAYFPHAEADVITRTVQRLDTDTSKFLRAAVREKLQRESAA
jgi:hypothetical protein